MILVDEIAARGAPWSGGRSCHLISDSSATELLDFGRRLGIPLAWFQHRGTIPHWDLSPRWRARAIAAGARPVDRRRFVEGV